MTTNKYISDSFSIEELKSLSKYRESNNLKSTLQVITSFVPFLILWYLAYISLDYSYALVLLISLLNLGFVSRIFIIQHDCGHGSMYKSKKLQNTIGFFCSLISLIPYHYWRKVHTIHHADLGDLDNRYEGEFPVLTVKEFQNSSKKEQRVYKVMRNPFFLLAILPTLLFFILYRFPRSHKAFTKKEKYTVYFTDFVMLAIIILMSNLIGLKEFLLVQVPLNLFFATAGVWAFYIEHQFENTYWKDNKNHNFFDAALKGSSYLKLPKIFNWFTGNVGYHHIHHLSVKIPNYNLEKCFVENPNLHNVTSFTFLESFKFLNHFLWDEKENRLISFKEFKNNY